MCATQNSNPVEILKDPFIAKIIDPLLASLHSESVINFLDKSTWQEGDYEPVRRQICEVIVPHALNQQWVECMVQNINFMSRTNVKENRRTARVVVNSISNLPFNRESVDKKREEKPTMKEKLKVKRVNGAERNTGHFTHVQGLFEEAEVAVVEVGNETLNVIVDHYRNPNKKTSAAEREKNVDKFEAATEKPRNITKAQRSGKIDIPVSVGGGIPLIHFAAIRKNEEIVRKEIAHRRIKLDGKELKLNEEPLMTMALAQMKDELRKDEAAILACDDKVRAGGTTWTKINTVQPRSDEMQAEVNNYLARRDSNND